MANLQRPWHRLEVVKHLAALTAVGIAVVGCSATPRPGPAPTQTLHGTTAARLSVQHARYLWYIHCGFAGLTFHERSWTALAPIQHYPGARPAADGTVSDGLYVQGTVTVLSPDLLEFVGDPALLKGSFIVRFTPSQHASVTARVCA